ncbi:DNA-3-methyladenine glycosylase I [Ruminococcaceae bacterium OttesenSCG-928-L11]|nr:DNA-3-methyladenine glycosylase I [Ruminococcaceae bacterium OttesenSCG-928-L11]
MIVDSAEIRCAWARHPLEVEYHDNEWGKPLHDERELFEMLILEGMQAGLSWLGVLKKREAFREAFDRFDPAVVAAYSDEKLASLLENPGIIRNRLKIQAARTNARAFLQVQAEYGSFDAYVWGFVGGVPIVNRWEQHEQVPAFTALSDQLSKDLKKRGFKFVGSTICYSYMQSIGMVNDHLVSCREYRNCAARTPGKKDIDSHG